MMRTSLPATVSLLLLCSACGQGAQDAAETCATPTPPARVFRDCGAGEPPALTATEYACIDNDGAYSLIQWGYPAEGLTFLYRNGVTMLAADGASVPACWSYRGIDLPTKLGCSLKYTWTRCATPTAPTPPTS